ncbi:hypothetical protein [Methylobacter sp. BBA5.1]|uniref:hypothetical protein n=1 Tax=Methylobacter sp. BBA5.1 TaxID=1495064 RepID=UPI000559DD1A|nr:hypothetical protein [Methylobacter sp. BBA5.1]
MNTPFQFWTPAKQIDFPNHSGMQAALEAQWNINLNGFTQQGITGNPWNSTNATGISNYFNPLDTAIPQGATVANITWSAFPGRIGFYFPQLSDQEQLALADTGYQTNKQSFPPITKDPCTGQSENLPYGPYGPRGWQDEYCEWSVTRNAQGKIIRVDFVCENPEYWNSLWMIDPNRVLELYQSTLGKPQIRIEDLYLYDKDNKVVIDPSTGRPGYNPLNKWNSGTDSSDAAGGAMHLTSTPNTLQTEIGLASAATLQRKIGNNDPNALICCAQYGQPHRNSDPHIGQTTNKLVSFGNAVTLTNPPGLYIQMPDFSSYRTPDGTDPAAFWTIMRGTKTLNGENGQLPGNFILHATYAVPPDKGYTVSDITINNQPIQWGGQIARTFLMQIVATAIDKAAPPALDCVGPTSGSDTLAQPLQLFHADIFKAMAYRPVANPVNQAMTLISNSTLIAPLVRQGALKVPMVLTGATVQPGNRLPAVSITGDGVTATAIGSTSSINYAVPGNSYPSEATAMLLEVSVASNATPGLRGLHLTNYGQPQGAAMPALINVVAAGAIQTQ